LLAGSPSNSLSLFDDSETHAKGSTNNSKNASLGRISLPAK